VTGLVAKKMELIMEMTVINKPEGIFSHSCIKHYFYINNISEALSEKLLKLLINLNYYGCWNIETAFNEIYTVDYETNDFLEATEEFAADLETVIAKQIKKLT